ncbi:hypothetical protein SARC_01230 [Sphaeroforma arctica JP610]|uniref:Potassium channel domain-containing protein n=1 Tax=Sphaeroforma arctica JP610 TaxID=667725 RepID=A0A0L0GCP0_9EUKA|nr:hypothetical protein SARC_01230 [Sphaeroforma arctica JP610]KNC86651.1 hypothetical protein SARC_01230 [Sphaeroforma arctica JP610]|eukprot:XP_014160553.1 hypothetical protein SARC_01230 [Sphaeroforma arctica JP610]
MDKDDFGFLANIDAWYFSTTIMSTVGFGDFSPKTNFSKIVVMINHAIILLEIVSLLFGTKSVLGRVFENTHSSVSTPLSSHHFGGNKRPRRCSRMVGRRSRRP